MENSISSVSSHVTLLDGERPVSDSFLISEGCDIFDFDLLDQIIENSAEKTRFMDNATARYMSGIDELHSQHAEQNPKAPRTDLPAIPVERDSMEVPCVRRDSFDLAGIMLAEFMLENVIEKTPLDLPSKTRDSLVLEASMAKSETMTIAVPKQSTSPVDDMLDMFNEIVTSPKTDMLLPRFSFLRGVSAM